MAAKTTPATEPRASVDGYAQKAGNTAERSGGTAQIGDPNTKASTKGAAVPPGPCDDSVTPRDPAPYANTTGVVATRRDGEGL